MKTPEEQDRLNKERFNNDMVIFYAGMIAGVTLTFIMILISKL